MAIRDNLDNTIVTINCPGCNCPIEIKLIQVRLEEVIFCPACNREVQLKDVDGSLSNASKTIEKSLQGLTDKLKRL